MNARGRSGRRLARARAGVITIALALHAVAACPVERMDPETQRDPRTLTAASEASALFAALGVRTTAAALVAGTTLVVNAWCDLQTKLLIPVGPLFDRFQIHQRWSLFTTAPRRRWRMDVEVQHGADAPFTLFYRPHDTSHRGLADVLEYRRVRGVWNPGTEGVRPTHRHFVRWLARTIFARDPSATAVRVRMFVLVLPTAGDTEPAIAEQPHTDELVVRRGEENAL